MKTKSLQRSLGSMTLAFQSFIIFFGMLAAFGLKVTDDATVWITGLTLSILAIALPGVLGKKGSYVFGWGFQFFILALSIFTILFHWLGYIFLVFSMIFIGLWAWAMIAGSTVDAANRVLQNQTNDQNGIEENK